MIEFMTSAKNVDCVGIRDLPTGRNVDFKDTSFFLDNNGNNGSENPSLPSPEQVREKARLLGRYKQSGLGLSRPVHILSLRLTVKFGSDITLAEGQCLWAIARFLRNKVPVPEIYGWRHDGGEVFLYMQRIEGTTLEERWDGLDDEQRRGVCEQLRKFVQVLNTLQQDVGKGVVGSINGEPIRDIIVEPFLKKNAPENVHESVRSFHDWLAGLANRHHPNLAEYVDLMRDGLPDDAQIAFTHGDLHPSNIMVSSADEETDDKHPQVLAILDWHQSGWYPAYWEYCKALYTVDPNSEWAQEYIPRFLEPPTCRDYWLYYTDALG